MVTSLLLLPFVGGLAGGFMSVFSIGHLDETHDTAPQPETCLCTRRRCSSVVFAFSNTDVVRLGVWSPVLTIIPPLFKFTAYCITLKYLIRHICVL